MDIRRNVTLLLLLVLISQPMLGFAMVLGSVKNTATPHLHAIAVGEHHPVPVEQTLSHRQSHHDGCVAAAETGELCLCPVNAACGPATTAWLQTPATAVRPDGHWSMPLAPRLRQRLIDVEPRPPRVL